MAGAINPIIYKAFQSVVMLTQIDSDYKLLWRDEGTNGAISNAVIFKQSQPLEYIVTNQLGIPAKEPIMTEELITMSSRYSNSNSNSTFIAEVTDSKAQHHKHSYKNHCPCP